MLSEANLNVTLHNTRSYYKNLIKNVIILFNSLGHNTVIGIRSYLYLALE